MNEFYSTELNESNEIEEAKDENVKNRKYKALSVISDNSPMKRNKKPTQKAQKLWESIASQVDAGSSSDDNDEKV